MADLHLADDTSTQAAARALLDQCRELTKSGSQIEAIALAVQALLSPLRTDGVGPNVVLIGATQGIGRLAATAYRDDAIGKIAIEVLQQSLANAYREAARAVELYNSRMAFDA